MWEGIERLNQPGETPEQTWIRLDDAGFDSIYEGITDPAERDDLFWQLDLLRQHILTGRTLRWLPDEQETSAIAQDAGADVGKWIRAHRILAGLRQRDLAVRAHIERSALSRIEGGRRSMSIAEATHVADVLGVRLDVLIGRQLEERTASTSSAARS